MFLNYIFAFFIGITQVNAAVIPPLGSCSKFLIKSEKIGSSPIKKVTLNDLRSYVPNRFIEDLNARCGRISISYRSQQDKVRRIHFRNATIVGRFKSTESKTEYVIFRTFKDILHSADKATYYTVPIDNIEYFHWGSGQRPFPISTLRNLTPGDFVTLDRLNKKEGYDVVGRFISANDKEVTLLIDGENRTFRLSEFRKDIWIGSKIPSLKWLRSYKSL